MKSRFDILTDLIELKRPFDDIHSDLIRLPGKFEPGDVPTLTRSHATRLLHEFLEDRLSASDLDQWASLIECRDDIQFEGESQALREMVFQLAHPLVTQPLDAGLAYELIIALANETEA